ncbi:glutathione S-transferase family protein [Pendulispora albinea]|uniref:Glutathione S-transferase family protein n=1 Tax=Pendulispora albinea TaxID=2741071 RepID=A0ABZ2M0Z8_9BACT
MGLTLYSHPLASYCQKVLIALYELEVPFEQHVVDLMNPAAAAEHIARWPVGKMPLLHDGSNDRTLPESSIIIEYLDRHYSGKASGKAPLLPADTERALHVRLQDRFYDLYVQTHIQKIVGDRIRPAGASDPHGVDGAKTQLRTAYDMIERSMASQPWAAGAAFTMADCAAAPALFYANLVVPFGDTHPNAAAYLARLRERPSVARTFEEAKPYLHLFPREPRA